MSIPALAKTLRVPCLPPLRTPTQQERGRTPQWWFPHTFLPGEEEEEREKPHMKTGCQEHMGRKGSKEWWGHEKDVEMSVTANVLPMFWNTGEVWWGVQSQERILETSRWWFY